MWLFVVYLCQLMAQTWLILLVFAFAFVEWIFDLIAPTLSISPFAHVNPKRAKSAHFAAAVPPILLGVFFLVRFLAGVFRAFSNSMQKIG